MEDVKVLADFFKDQDNYLLKTRRLIVLLGSFGDFDSFEHAQQLFANRKKLEEWSIQTIVIGIGSEKSKDYFCRFNKLDLNNVIALNNADLHKKLHLDCGLDLPLPSIFNLLLMCAGINSKGTIKEVLRGYLGDINSDAIFSPCDELKIGPFSLVKGNMFDFFSRSGKLRPFELATRRLMNMIEILSNWNIYVPDPSFLTQRGGTLLIDENDELIYIFKSVSLLGYSDNMSSPLSFLDSLL